MSAPCHTANTAAPRGACPIPFHSPALAASQPAPPPPGRVMLLPLLSRPRLQARRLRPARTQLPSGARQKPPQTHAKSFWHPLGWWPICGVPHRGAGVLRPPEGAAGGLGGEWRRHPLLRLLERDTWMWNRSQGGVGWRSRGGTRGRVGEAALTFSRSLRYQDGVCSASNALSTPRSLGWAALAEPYAGLLAVG